MLLQLIFTVLFYEVFIQSCELSRFDFIFKAQRKARIRPEFIPKVYQL